MSDLDPAAEADPVEETSTTSPPPWGEDFQPERAWQTITHLRGREKELESDAKAFKRLREDEDARREFLAELGYEVADDEEDSEEEVTDSYEEEETPSEYQKRLEALEAREQERQANAAVQQFKDHVTDLAAKAEVELDDDDVEFLFTKSVNQGFTEKATEAAFEKYVERNKAREAQILERYRGAKKAPAVVPDGKSASQVPNLDNARDRQAWMLERLNSGD